MNNRKRVPISHFLICSFIGLLLFSIFIFTSLGFYMNRISEETIYEVGNIYMSGMNEKTPKNFENSPISEGAYLVFPAPYQIRIVYRYLPVLYHLQTGLWLNF